MIANHHKQDLNEHLIAVSQLSYFMAENIGLPGNLVECARIAGLLHDIGKAADSFQNYMRAVANGTPADDSDPTLEYENIIDKPLHHEISWAFLAGQISNEKNSILLSAIYWHHARPLDESYENFKTHDEILENATGINKVKTLFKVLRDNNRLNLDEYESTDSISVPDFFCNDGTLNRNTNAQLLSVRGCLIAADRYISGLSAADVHTMVADAASYKNILAKLAGKGTGAYSKPQRYDLNRFSLQESCALEAQKERTALIKAPAGFGKTIVGLIWSTSIGGRLIWVCPRNVVTESVYQSICTELLAMKMSCTVELYLTGKRQQCNFSEELPDFSADIIVTNIDNLLAPMVSNRIASRLYTVVGSTMVFDEFHELISDAPLFAAFITLMRARHRISSTAKTLLLSATPTNVYRLWDEGDDGKKTRILPDENTHYPAAHKGNYAIEFLSAVPTVLKHGSLTICNSIKKTQKTFSATKATIIAHSAYTDDDRRSITADILSRFGKGGKGIDNGDMVVSAPIIQAAMDISFKELNECMLSPEATLQRIGRCDRWGHINATGQMPVIRFIDITNDPSEDGAVRTMYDKSLRRGWIDFITSSLKNMAHITLDELYLLYNKFYAEKHDEIYRYIRESYRQGINLLVDRYTPVKLKMPREQQEGTGRSLRSPFGSYFFTVRTGAGQWLGPDQVLSEGFELWTRYHNNGERTSRLCNAGAMRGAITELGTTGYMPYVRLARRNRIPDNLEKWFRIARNRETPLPDISRTYDIKHLAGGLTGTGLGLIDNTDT